jgi:hypothetical protein
MSVTIIIVAMVAMPDPDDNLCVGLRDHSSEHDYGK